MTGAKQRAFGRAGWTLLGLGIVALAGVAEMSVRLAMPAFNPSNHLRFEAPRGDRPTLGNPGSQRQINNVGDYDVAVTFNRHGFRDRRDLAQSAPGDVFVVGDSFAFGWGVAEDERFSNRLEAFLDRRVFNIASPVNIADYPDLIAYAEGRGARIGRLVVAVNMYDDLAPAARGGEGNAVLAAIGPAAAKGFLLANSALYFLVSRVGHGSPTLKQLLIRAGVVLPVDAATAPVYGPEAIEAAADVLAGLARRFATTVLLIPDSSRWTAANRDDARRTHERFAAALGARGLSVVDLVPVFENGGAPTRHQFSGDRHWTPAGHDIAARALAAAMTRAP